MEKSLADFTTAKECYKKQKLHDKIPIEIYQRRYEKLQEIIEETDFYSEENIKIREPILYYIYIGKYKSGKSQPVENFSEFLFHQMTNNEYKDLLLKQFEKLDDRSGIPDPQNREYIQIKELSEEQATENEDQLMRILFDKFLLGEEKSHFNYEEIDSDEKYDRNKFKEQDQEDEYFDGEEQNVTNKERTSEDTNQQDF